MNFSKSGVDSLILHTQPACALLWQPHIKTPVGANVHYGQTAELQSMTARLGMLMFCWFWKQLCWECSLLTATVAELQGPELVSVDNDQADWQVRSDFWQRHLNLQFGLRAGYSASILAVAESAGLPYLSRKDAAWKPDAFSFRTMHFAVQSPFWN